MSISTTLLESHGARTLLADKINNGSYPVGGVYQLDYSSCTVLTDDYRKKEAGGIPKGGFLLAAACKHTPGGFVLDDEEIILLRVTGTAPLPNEVDLVQTRLAVVRDATDSSRNFIEVTDELTRAELQQSAFACEVIGTFYTLPGNDSQEILFGADIDNVYSSARYQVFLPSADVLSWLCSYPQNDQNENVLTIGKARFASTMRRAIESKQSEADVNIVIEDFISRKTAVFGMTRTGKSNTIKTIVTAIADYSARTNKKVGQLIFDPQGEYANINEQDKTGLRLLGEKKEDSSVRIYRLGKKSEFDPQVFP